ncbi:MAG: choice-of-anchor Q domain-containing protein [Bacteroidota bacterium]
MRYAALNFLYFRRSLSLLVFCLTTQLQAQIYHVRPSGNDSNDGLSWSQSFASLQAALDIASDGASIYIAEGTYFPTKEANGNSNPANPRDKTFFIDKQLSIFGGFPATGNPDILDIDVDAHPTILSGDLGVLGDENDNAFTVVRVSSVLTCDLFALHFRFGYAGGSNGTSVQVSGGAIYHETSANFSSTLNITLCRFENNQALANGGAIYHSADGGLTFTSIRQCLFRNNLSFSSGGAIAFDGDNGEGSLLVSNSIFTNNRANFGGDVFAYNDGLNDSEAYFGHCTFWNNGIEFAGENVGTISGWNDNQVMPILENCISWGNPSFEFSTNIGGFELRSCLIQAEFCPNGSSCSGVIFNQDPQLQDPVNGNFEIAACSPAVDEGNVTAVSTNDYDGDLRPAGNTPDIGAQEYFGPSCCPPSGIIYVNASASGQNTGHDWANALTDLQSALDRIANGGCPGIFGIWIAEGFYSPSKDRFGNDDPADPRTKTFFFDRNINVTGGFPATGNPGLADASPNNPTILSGNTGSLSSFADNVYTVVHTKDLGEANFSNLIIEDGNASDFSSNNSGGGWYNESSVFVTSQLGYSPVLSQVTFRNNRASRNGAAFYNEPTQNTGSASPHFQSCTFSNNVASNKGGAVYSAGDNGNVDMRFDNSIFTVNESAFSGAAIAWDDPVIGSLLCNNSTLYNNQSTLVAGEAVHIAFWDSGKQPLIFINCSFSEGASADVTNVSGPDLQMTHCLLPETSCPPGVDCSGGGNLFNLPPSYVDAQGGDFHLQTCSPGIDAGTDPFLIVEDFEGDARPQGSAFDIGADEFVGVNDCCPMGPAIFVDQDATNGRKDGTSWENAFTDLQPAIDLLESGNCPQPSEIWVAEGTYLPTENLFTDSTDARFRSFQLNFNTKIYGGFSGSETQRSQRDIDANPTTLSGEIGNTGTSDNVYSVVTVFNGERVVIDGFTISGGRADLPFIPFDGYFTSDGGGIYVNGSTGAGAPRYLQIDNCIIENNFAQRGGGLFARNVLDRNFISCTNTIFRNNTAAEIGGGAMTEAKGTMVDNRFTACQFLENEVQNGTGGGLSIYWPIEITAGQGIVQLDYCSFYGNTASDGGAIGYNELRGLGGGGLRINHCSLVANSSASGGAIKMNRPIGPAEPTILTNCLLWDNGQNFQGPNVLPPPIDLSHCLIEESSCPTNINCTNVIFNQDPLLEDPENGDLNLMMNSPAIDEGLDFPGLPTEDLAGNLVPQGGARDLGAYESPFIALPVEWLYFRVVDGHRSGTARLEWATTFEIDNDRFEIQRSSTGRAWETIGQVAANPTSGSPNTYRWIDEQPLSGYNFYRLRQVDLDGNYDFSELQTWVLNGTSAGLIVYPNPASSEVLVEGLIEHIRVFDLNGRLCIEQAPSRDGPTRLDVSYLPAGIYALQAGSKTSRIVIDR